jgi:glycosyltransferase involved in cell wall biosynthesis
LAFGGAETQVVRLALELKKRAWHVQVLCMIDPSAFVEQLEEAGVEIASLQMARGRWSVSAVRKAVVRLRVWKPAVLVSFNFPANLMARLVSPMVPGCAVITSFRSEWFGSRRRDGLLRLTDRFGAVSVSNSHFAAKRLVARGVVPASRIRVIPNGVAPFAYQRSVDCGAKVRRALGVPPETFVWLAIGRLEPAKDYPTLFSAVTRLVGDGGQIVLIAGTGPLESALADMTEKNEHLASVRLLGLRDDVPELLSAADAFVLSSAWEGMPNVVMEALSAGKPVVATRVGGVPELVQDGVSGYLVSPGDPGELAGAMGRMMALPLDERQAMGIRGKEHIERNYSLATVVDAWESLFAECVRQ